jgi:hypothetical protein
MWGGWRGLLSTPNLLRSLGTRPKNAGAGTGWELSLGGRCFAHQTCCVRWAQGPRTRVRALGGSFRWTVAALHTKPVAFLEHKAQERGCGLKGGSFH